MNLIAHDLQFWFKCPHPQERLFQWRLFTSEVDIACESRCLFWLLSYPEEPKKTLSLAGYSTDCNVRAEIPVLRIKKSVKPPAGFKPTTYQLPAELKPSYRWLVGGQRTLHILSTLADTSQGSALAVLAGPWHLTFAPRRLFCRNHMLGTLDFTGSEHWAPSIFLRAQLCHSKQQIKLPASGRLH